MTSRSVARRKMVQAALLVVGMAASESLSQPAMAWPPPIGGPPPMGGLPRMGGPPPMGGLPRIGGPPPMGGMMGPPRFGPGMGTGFRGIPGPSPMKFPPSMGPGGIPGGTGMGGPPGGGMGIGGRPRPGLSPLGAGRPHNLQGDRAADRGLVGTGGSPWAGRTVNPHHAALYHGGWADYRGGTSYDPRYYGAAAWGRYGWPSSWGYGDGGGGYGDGGGGDGDGGGYGGGYGDASANPSYDASSADGDRSRPVTAQGTDPGGEEALTSKERGYRAFDRARDAFKAGDYAAALDLTDAALRDLPGDPVVHEFKALVLFARGEYAGAAAELHAVLDVTSGMDWTTLCGLYPDVQTYTGQLRALEDRCRQDPKAAAPRLVLAYHYLVAGHKDAAVAQLKALLAEEPGDRVARRLIVSLTATPPTSSGPTQTVPDGDGAAVRPPAVDLVGRWRGDRDGSTFDLSLDGRGRFLWQAARQGKATATVSGAYALSGDTLLLKPEGRSPLSASLTALSPDSFRFKTVGDVPVDPGLVFGRATMPAAPARD